MMTTIRFHDLTSTGRYVDLDGTPVRRDPDNYPYSYEAYVTYMCDYDKDKAKTVYSDRLYQWDLEKFNNCCDEVFGDHGQYFDNRSPAKINEFLNKYFEKDVKLTAIMKGCNVSNGFPLWIFMYEDLG